MAYLKGNTSQSVNLQRNSEKSISRLEKNPFLKQRFFHNMAHQKLLEIHKKPKCNLILLIHNERIKNHASYDKKLHKSHIDVSIRFSFIFMQQIISLTEKSLIRNITIFYNFEFEFWKFLYKLTNWEVFAFKWVILCQFWIKNVDFSPMLKIYIFIQTPCTNFSNQFWWIISF